MLRYLPQTTGPGLRWERVRVRLRYCPLESPGSESGHRLNADLKRCGRKKRAAEAGGEKKRGGEAGDWRGSWVGVPRRDNRRIKERGAGKRATRWGVGRGRTVLVVPCARMGLHHPHGIGSEIPLLPSLVCTVRIGTACHDMEDCDNRRGRQTFSSAKCEPVCTGNMPSQQLQSGRINLNFVGHLPP